MSRLRSPVSADRDSKLDGRPVVARGAADRAGAALDRWSGRCDGIGAGAVIDLGYLVVLDGVTVREIVSGRNWRISSATAVMSFQPLTSPWALRRAR